MCIVQLTLFSLFTVLNEKVITKQTFLPTWFNIYLPILIFRDAVIMKKGSTYTKLSELPAGSIIGTSSLRRSAQLKANYPGLVFRVSFVKEFILLALRVIIFIFFIYPIL